MNKIIVICLFVECKELLNRDSNQAVLFLFNSKFHILICLFFF